MIQCHRHFDSHFLHKPGLARFFVDSFLILFFKRIIVDKCNRFIMDQIPFMLLNLQIKALKES